MKNTVTRPQERRARQKARLQEQILDAARALFAERGYAAVTMRGIARQIGYTATALYYHFPDKESLLRELCRRDFQALSAAFRRLGRVADPVKRIRQAGRAYVRFGLRYPQQYRFMFLTPYAEPTPEEVQIEQGNPDQDAYAFLLQAVSEAMSAERLRPELRDPHLVAQALWAGVHGLVALHLNWESGTWVRWRPAAKTARLIIAATVNGLLRRTP